MDLVSYNFFYLNCYKTLISSHKNYKELSIILHDLNSKILPQYFIINMKIRICGMIANETTLLQYQMKSLFIL